MRIYYYDKSNRYIGSRLLAQNEVCPASATTVAVILNDDQQAHFINNKWVISGIPTPTQATQPSVLTLEELQSQIAELQEQVLILLGV